MKYFRMSYEEVVFKRSYLNILLLNRSIPSFRTNSKSDKENLVGRGFNGKKRPTEQKFRNEQEFFLSMM